MSEFEHRDKDEINRDNLQAILILWTGVLILGFVPSPLNVYLVGTLSLVFHSKVRVALEWLGRSPGYVLSYMWSVFTWPIRLAKWALFDPIFWKDTPSYHKLLLVFIWLDALLIMWLLIWITW